MPKKPTKKPDSNSKSMQFGMEFELFTLDQTGKIVNKGEDLFKRVQKENPSIDVEKECGKNMIEIKTLPEKEIPDIMLKAMNDYEAVLHAAEKENIVLYSYGTYPGAFTPEFTKAKGYKIKEKIFGKQRFLHAARCIGLHCHYSLPKGVFDFKNRMIKHLVNSKNKQSLVDMYNLFIAMDPAVGCFAQSSPFYQGARLGKDARAIVYRGGDIMKYPLGLYTNHQDFGMLQPYKVTGTDLLQIIQHRYDNWKTIVRKTSPKQDVFSKRKSILDTTWNPVKISSLGTMEQRGMDINHPRVIIALATLIEFISKEVQDEFVHILPSDIGLTDPFKREDNIIYIPPHTHVRFNLQLNSAYHGFENDDVYKYCAGLLKLAKQCVPKERLVLLEPLEAMLKNKKTVSDEIITDAKKMGVSNKISTTQAAELALKHSKDLFKEIILTKQIIKKLE